MIKKCLCCNKEFHTIQAKVNSGKGKYCSRECWGKSRPLGPLNHKWNGGEMNCGKYVKVYRPGHPRAINKYVLKHILVMEKHLGFEIRNPSVIHHIDGNPQNNDIGNLMLFPTDREHKLWHRRERIINAGGNPEEDQICCICKKLKPLSGFNKDKKMPNGYCCQCRKCVSDYYKKRKRDKRDNKNGFNK